MLCARVVQSCEGLKAAGIWNRLRASEESSGSTTGDGVRDGTGAGSTGCCCLMLSVAVTAEP